MKGRSSASWLLLALALGCGSTRRNPHQSQTETPTDSAGGTANGDAGAGGSGTAPRQDCAPPAAAVVRLSFSELVETVKPLLGAAFAEQAALALDLRAENLTFPPLASPREGNTIVDSIFLQGDKLAQLAGEYVRDHFTEVTACDAAELHCVRQYVNRLAARAFRRPLSESEESALLQVVDQAEALGVSPPIAAQYGTYAVFESPHFLYRTELGITPLEGPGKERRLTDHELASHVSYFLTGAPPDQELASAADAGALSDAAELPRQVDRLLSTPPARQYLERLLASYLRVPAVGSVVLDSAVYPNWSARLAASMEQELYQLLSLSLWQGPVENLLTTRESRIDASLANLYGVEFPPAGTKLDKEGWASLQLPETRAGLLTRAGLQAVLSRPDGPSLVSRGLFVAQKLLCAEIPPEQEGIRRLPELPHPTQRALARQRLTLPECSECHRQFDPFGIALEDLDAVGQLRTVAEAGAAVDAAAALPDGTRVDGSVQLSQALDGEALANCLSQRFIELSLPDRDPGTCERDNQAAARAENGDRSFKSVLRQIVLSGSFSARTWTD